MSTIIKYMETISEPKAKEIYDRFKAKPNTKVCIKHEWKAYGFNHAIYTAICIECGKTELINRY